MICTSADIGGACCVMNFFLHFWQIRRKVSTAICLQRGAVCADVCETSGLQTSETQLRPNGWTPGKVSCMNSKSLKTTSQQSMSQILAVDRYRSTLASPQNGMLANTERQIHQFVTVKNFWLR